MSDRVAHFIAHRLLHVPVKTAARDARLILAASDHRDKSPVASVVRGRFILSHDEWQARLLHECAHAECARAKGAEDIDVLIRDDGTGWVSYSAIANPLDAITTHLVGVPAEVRYFAPSLRRYSDGCYDFLAARLLIDAWNERGEWPPLTCEAAAKTAVEFVEKHWQSITDLALVLGSSGTLSDSDVRLFATCRQ